MKRTILLILLQVAFILPTHAQDSTDTKGKLTLSAYADSYLAYDFNKPASNNRPDFLYSFNRHQEVNLNLGYIKAAYVSSGLRANLALAAGTYVNANYAAEPVSLKHLLEANMGLKISRKNNLWVDAGIFSSHIGFESAVSKDCATLTRSLMAENSPYYEAGIKCTYISKNDKWLFSGMLLNGWQRITRVEGNSLFSFGTQIQYKPSSKYLINYSTFIGTDQPDSTRLMRYFHNFYALGKLGSQWNIQAGFDIGFEQKSKGSASLQNWYSPVLILQYIPSAQWKIAARGEYYHDPNNVIIKTAKQFQTTGFSLNVDYAPAAAALVRIEFRSLQNKEPIFLKEGQIVKSNNAVTASLAVSF